MTIAEIELRSLTLEELADRMTSHEDQTVRAFAERVLQEIDDAIENAIEQQRDDVE